MHTDAPNQDNVFLLLDSPETTAKQNAHTEHLASHKVYNVAPFLVKPKQIKRRHTASIKIEYTSRRTAVN